MKTVLSMAIIIVGALIMSPNGTIQCADVGSNVDHCKLQLFNRYTSELLDLLDKQEILSIGLINEEDFDDLLDSSRGEYLAAKYVSYVEEVPLLFQNMRAYVYETRFVIGSAEDIVIQSRDSCFILNVDPPPKDDSSAYPLEECLSFLNWCVAEENEREYISTELLNIVTTYFEIVQYVHGLAPAKFLGHWTELLGEMFHFDPIYTNDEKYYQSRRTNLLNALDSLRMAMPDSIKDLFQPPYEIEIQNDVEIDLVLMSNFGTAYLLIFVYSDGQFRVESSRSLGNWW